MIVVVCVCAADRGALKIREEEFTYPPFQDRVVLDISVLRVRAWGFKKGIVLVNVDKCGLFRLNCSISFLWILILIRVEQDTIWSSFCPVMTSLAFDCTCTWSPIITFLWLLIFIGLNKDAMSSSCASAWASWPSIGGPPTTYDPPNHIAGIQRTWYSEPT